MWKYQLVACVSERRARKRRQPWRGRGRCKTGEAYSAGSDVAETPLRVEEKTRMVPVPGRKGEGSTRCSSGKGEGWIQQRGETRQVQWVSAVAMRQEGVRDKAVTKKRQKQAAETEKVCSPAKMTAGGGHWAFAIQLH